MEKRVAYFLTYFKLNFILCFSGSISEFAAAIHCISSQTYYQVSTELTVALTYHYLTYSWQDNGHLWVRLVLDNEGKKVYGA